MNILIYDQQKAILLDQERLKKKVTLLVDYLRISTNEISFHFVDKKVITDLHKKYFDDPTETDCITFPISDDGSDYHILGEIFICTDVAIEYAKKNEIDPQDEVLLYMIHGLLHLIGYDDIDKKDRTDMRKKEKSCMDYIKAQII